MKTGETMKYDERLRIVRVYDDIYLIDDNDEGTAYVVLGKEKALVVDTCNGFQDYSAVVRSLTELPAVVVNTHAHGDHVGGNRFFEKAYIGAEEVPFYEEHYHTPCPVEILNEGDTIDLGGKIIEVIKFAGHTPGAICLLDRADRVLFTGDSVLGRTVWLFMDNSTPVSTMKRSLIHLNEFRSEFDTLLTGHSRKPDDPAYIDSLIEACDTVLAGAPAERFGSFTRGEVTLPTCFYKGEDGMDGTLVFHPSLAK